MRELLDQLDAWTAEGATVGRAVVVRTFGSAPRPEGGVLLVTADGRLAGSVSGGCVEGAAAEEIFNAFKNGRQRVIRYGISDEAAWDVGLACGGTIDVLGGRGRARDGRCRGDNAPDRRAAGRLRAAHARSGGDTGPDHRRTRQRSP
jgi:xanthine/CO dehydrogenase XdhC/CoxF family maturation factor